MAEPTGFVHPIYTATEAVSKTLMELRPSFQPTEWQARLISRMTLDVAWHDQDVPQDDPATPIWLVGVLGSGASLDDVYSVAGLPGVRPTDTPPDAFPGVYYAWDAGSGDIVAQGLLLDGSKQSYSQLIALENEDLTISPAEQPLEMDDVIATNDAGQTQEAETPGVP